MEGFPEKAKERLGVQAACHRERTLQTIPERMECEAVRVRLKLQWKLHKGRGDSNEQNLLRKILGREQSQLDKAA